MPNSIGTRNLHLKLTQLGLDAACMLSIHICLFVSTYSLGPTKEIFVSELTASPSTRLIYFIFQAGYDMTKKAAKAVFDKAGTDIDLRSDMTF